MNLKIEYNEDHYSEERRFVVTFGMSHLAYGSTPQEAADNFNSLANKLKP